MLRRTPLRRHTWMHPSGRKSKYRRRLRDVPFMLFVKRLACSARDLGPCKGPVEADHVGPHGLSNKGDDRLCIPMCAYHHRCRTDFSGPFRDFNQATMRLFVARALVATQTAARELGVIQFAQPATP